jgi:hypothetical protein
MPWALESRHDPSMRRSSGEGWRPRCGRVGTAKYPVSGGGYFLGKMRRHGEVRRGGSQKLQGEQAGKVTKERGELRAGGLVCCGQAGHKQDGRSREKAGLTLLVANVLVCEERGSVDVRCSWEASRLASLLLIFVEKQGEKQHQIEL